MKLEKIDTINDYGEPMEIAINDTYIIYPFLGIGYIFTTRDNYSYFISDVRKETRLYKRDGFNTLDDCIEYIEKYFK